MTQVITVLIADDHPIFRAGLRQVIETSPDVRVIAEAGDGDAALASIESAAPDMIASRSARCGASSLKTTSPSAATCTPSNR